MQHTVKSDQEARPKPKVGELADAPTRQRRKIAIVIAYEGQEAAAELAARFGGTPHTIELWCDERYARTGVPKRWMVDATDVARCVNGKFRKSPYDFVMFVYDAEIGAEELVAAAQSLAESDKPAYYLVPGLNELLTVRHIAMTAFSIRNLKAKGVPEVPLGIRLKEKVAPRLPRPAKQILRKMLESFGMSQPFGLSMPTKRVSEEAVRISTSASVAGVLGPVVPKGMPHLYSLGTPELQQRYFVREVGRFFPYPSTVNIVLSNQCNLKCVMCPFHSPLFVPNRTTDYFDDDKWLPIDLIERLVDELKANKDPDAPITFHMGELDEPLMHPKIVRIVELLASVPRSTVHITSNGNLMREEIARGVIEGGLASMQFSVDAQTTETYKKIRGAKLEKVQRNVDRFLRIRDEIKPNLYVNLCIINQEGAADEIEDFKKYWRQKGASSVSVYQLFAPNGENKAQWVVPNKYFEEKKRTPCTALWDQCFLFPEGEISLCCTTLIRVPQDGVISTGNFRQRSLKDIWLGDKYQEIRRNLIYGKLEGQKYCAECDNWSSSYQFMKKAEDGTVLVFGESMGYYYFPEKNPGLVS
ncbi:MAG: radical SAM protein [Azospirillum sp.]|nr:radical SAM protein [Azospirillum sp.]